MNEQNVVWFRTPCIMADGCQCFKEDTASISSLSEDESSMCLWNINMYKIILCQCRTQFPCFFD